MKNDLCLFFKFILIIPLFLCFQYYTYALETPFIPQSHGIKAVIPYEENKGYSQNLSDNLSIPFFNAFSKEASGGVNGSFEYFTMEEKSNVKGELYSTPLLSAYGNNSRSLGESRRFETPSIYVRTAARYFSSSGDAGTGSITGGLAAGFYVGLDRYMDTGVIDAASSARSAALMAGSSYLGLGAGTFTANSIISPIFGSSLGSGFVNAFGSAAGGTAAGFIYAAGSYAFGNVDRHTARLMIAKSAFGSAASAGITAVIGTGTVTTGIFAVGTFAMPFVTALGAGYLVEKFFEFVDKQEERERIENFIKEIR